MSAFRSERIEFQGSQDHVLAGRLESPVGPARAYAVFAHCFTCSKDVVAATRISRALAERGIAVLRFDFTGLGNSDGEFANTNFSSNVGDLVAACRHLAAEFEAPRLLIGHSLGGAAVLAAASELSQVRAVATIGAPADPEHVTRLLADDVDEIHAEGEACVVLAGRTFRIQKQFLEDIGGHRLRDRLATMGKALLVLHAPGDDTVGVENARVIFDAARHPKSFVALDGADHLLTKREDAAFVADLLSAWAGRYVEEALSEGRASSGEGEVLVETRPGHRFTQRISVGGHELVADEPRSVGGDDLGPTPYDFLGAALGACTSMTLQMYAARKGIPLEAVRTRIRHDKVHAEDCVESETAGRKVDRLSREIELMGELDEEARARLLRIADKCAVHKTLHSTIEVRTTERR